MNKRWLSLFILVALLLILGGVRHSSVRSEAAADPVRRAAESSVTDATRGSRESWQNAAREKPQWLIEIAAQ